MKNKFILNFYLLLLAVVQFGYAQQLDIPIHLIEEPYLINAGAAGTSTALKATITSNFQWLNFEDAPSTQNFSIHMPFKVKQGIGLKINTDQIGPLKTFRGLVTYSYKVPITKDKIISIGLDAGVQYHGLDWSLFKSRDNTDSNIFATTESQATYVPEFNLGFYYSSEEYGIGLAINRLSRSKFGYTANNNSLNAQQKIHSYIHGHYNIAIMDKVKFIPSIVLNYTEGSPLFLSILGSLELNNLLKLNIGYRTGNAFVAGASYNIKEVMKLSYMYQQSRSDVINILGNSHELMLQFDLANYALNKKEKVEAIPE